MPQFTTSTGVVDVANWGYQLQGKGGLDAANIAKAHHDLIVMDFSSDGSGGERFSSDEIDAIKDGPGGRSVAVAYMSIGEASEFRDHWDSSWTQSGLANSPLSATAPDWLGPTNPDWPESRKVRYWDPDWQDVVFNDDGTGWLDQIVAQGFDAAYLDIVDAYYYWAAELPNSQRHDGDPARNDEKDSAQRMIDFVVDLTAHARETNPDFFVILQNGAFIIDALDGTDQPRKAALLDAIGAIAVEDTYFTGDRDINNGLHPDKDKIHVLQKDFLDNDIPVFTVDYINKPGKIDTFADTSIKDGFIPYAAHHRDLDQMNRQLGYTGMSGRPEHLLGTSSQDAMFGYGGADIIEGLDGDDVIVGNKQADRLFGGAGTDLLIGGKGHDRLFGNEQIDRLFGGAGNDLLIGGKGHDRLFGGDGDDLLKGGKGHDRLFGKDGDDRLVGGTGRDTLTGGAGADEFVFGKNGGKDEIRDFDIGTDTVRLNDNLWEGDLDAQDVLDQFGSQNGQNVVFTFDHGEMLTVLNTTKAELLDDLLIF